MRFKIISVGWQCSQFITRTLESIEAQSLDNYDVNIVDDASTDPRQAEIIRSWCDARDDRWGYTLNTERLGPVYNQYEGILALDPSDDDIIVWLDLDGDRFAHPDVLAHLADAYADGTLLTYGSYRPVPDKGTSSMATPYPTSVVESNTYRYHTLHVGTHFNHLRSMSGRIFRNIPEDQFHWSDGRWYEAAVDYIMMMCGLELAGGRYKCLPEVLMLYNHANPHSTDADYHLRTSQCNVHFLKRTPLEPLHPIMRSHRPEGSKEEWLPVESRRAVLRDYGQLYGLNVFIETGTHMGGTPMALKDDFKELHTIELGESMFQRARDMLRPYSQVTCWQGDSAEVLPKVLDAIDSPAVVWLDGHHSGPGTARGPVDSPIRDELRILFDDGRSHVILIDDMRCFDGGSEHGLEPHYACYPSISWLRKQAEANGYDFIVQDDIARLTPL